MFDPDIVEMEEEVASMLGTRVAIEPKEVGGRIKIKNFHAYNYISHYNKFNYECGKYSYIIPI